MDKEPTSALDWAIMRGHYHAKRMLEVAASGNHSLLLVGPSRSGKTTMARSLVTILPDIPFLEADSGELSDAFEQAGSGMVFLRHLEQWPDSSLARLRKTVAQQSGRILLIATASYCPCGNYADETKKCVCSREALEVYQSRLRQTIDACFALEAYIPNVNRFASVRPDESSRAVRERVEAARLIQYQRNGETRLNNNLVLREVEEYSPLDAPGQKLLEAARRQLALSPEQYLYLRQVTRTIADLANEDAPFPCIRAPRLAEAIQYRPRWRAK